MGDNLCSVCSVRCRNCRQCELSNQSSKRQPFLIGTAVFGAINMQCYSISYWNCRGCDPIYMNFGASTSEQQAWYLRNKSKKKKKPHAIGTGDDLQRHNEATNFVSFIPRLSTEFKRGTTRVVQHKHQLKSNQSCNDSCIIRLPSQHICTQKVKFSHVRKKFSNPRLWFYIIRDHVIH